MKLAEVKKQLDEYLRNDWIRPITFLYGDPILFNRKKDGILRVYVNYRALIQQTRPDKYLLSRIDDPLDWFVNELS